MVQDIAPVFPWSFDRGVGCSGLGSKRQNQRCHRRPGWARYEPFKYLLEDE